MIRVSATHGDLLPRHAGALTVPRRFRRWSARPPSNSQIPRAFSVELAREGSDEGPTQGIEAVAEHCFKQEKHFALGLLSDRLARQLG